MKRHGFMVRDTDGWVCLTNRRIAVNRCNIVIAIVDDFKNELNIEDDDGDVFYRMAPNILDGTTKATTTTTVGPDDCRPRFCEMVDKPG